MIPIIAPPAVPFATVYNAAKFQLPIPDLWYLQRALPALWTAGELEGVDPVVLAAQCALETSWGRFGGAVTKDWGNTCGLKHRHASGDKPEDHQRFPVLDGYPFVGAIAHAQHLRAYCGFPPYRVHPVVDPRIDLVKISVGEVLYVEDLSGRWAPGKDYGQKIAAIHKRLCGERSR